MSTAEFIPRKPVQCWQADDYAHNGRFVFDLGRPVVDLVAPKAGRAHSRPWLRRWRPNRIVCGFWRRRPWRRSERGAFGCKRLKVQRVEGHPLPFEGEFDAVFTKAALHWMRRPKLVIAGVDRALKPRGRFVGEFGGLCCGADQATLGALASPHPCQIHGRGHGLQGARRSARPDAGSEGAGHDATV
jgi:hypothetical protein